MVTSVHTGLITLDHSNDAGHKKLLSRSEGESETRAHLTSVLQTTLDLNQMLMLFYNHVQDTVPLDGLLYRNTNQHLQLQLGNDHLHKCDYRLITTKDKLGEVVFSRRQQFTATELARLELLLCTLIYPLRNALQYRMAITAAMRDTLTGVGNRTALDSALHRELQIAQRHKQAFSLLMIDIDHFKPINDTFGHATGDYVLSEIAGAIEFAIRKTDQTFRYGGEEFVVLLSKTTAAGSFMIAQRIRRYINNMDIIVNAKKIPISVSIGCSSLNDRENAKALLKRADVALYQAKKSGRNRVVRSAALGTCTK